MRACRDDDPAMDKWRYDPPAFDWATAEVIGGEEASARWARLLARADGNGCYIVHAPEIEGSYCEIHRKPILPGEADADHIA